MMRLFMVLVIALAYTVYHYAGQDAVQYAAKDASGTASLVAGEQVGSNDTAGQQAIQQAFASQRSDVQVQATGTVFKLLPDDNQGARHQRILLRLADGHSLLIVHNIDLAERIADVKVGDQLEFNGEYEWNAKGGLVHWTHHDPQGRHVGGWIRYQGRTYQ